MVFITTIFFPILVLLNGIANVKELWIELKKLYNQKKYGGFVSDYVPSNTKKYDEIMSIIKTVK
jgi:ABC-type nitrate/sulfonate/bicarbonate transport system permease component